MAVSTRTRPGTRSRPTRTVRSSSRSARPANSAGVPIWLFGVGAVLLLIIGFAIGTRAGGDGESRDSAVDQPLTTTTVAMRTAGPTSYREGIPVGFEHSARGAEAAATAFVQTGVELIQKSDVDAQAGLARMTTANGFAPVSKNFDTLFTQVRTKLAEAALASQQPGSTAVAGGAAFMHHSPVAARVVSYTNAQAVVELWGMSIVAVDGAPLPQATWGTETITLLWDEAAKDWRIDAWASVEGPTPVWSPTNPTPTADFLARVLTFSPLRAVPRN